MNRKQKIIVSITGIIIITLALIALTYAYFLARIKGNSSDKSIAGTFANLELTYADGNGILESSDAISPGTVIGTKTFSVENTGNGYVNYGVVLENVVNTLTRPEDLVYVLTCTSSDGKNCNGTASPEDTSGVNEKMFPTTDSTIVRNRIEKGVTHSYELTVTYKEANVDQSADMGATFSAKVNIENSLSEPLSEKILANAKSGTNGTTYRATPLTIPAKFSSNIKAQKIYSSYCLQTNDYEDYYITYADTYSFSEFNGYTLINPRVIKISDINSDLVGKYVINLKGESSNQISNSSNLSEIYKIESVSLNSICGVRYILQEVQKSAESTLSTAEDNSGTSYYYRGAVTDNYITFNNMCWRIVRIEGDGSIKIVLEDSKSTCDASTSKNNAFIDIGKYGLINNGNISVPDYSNAQNNSDYVRSKLNNWFYANFDSGLRDKIKEDTIYIGDVQTKYNYNGEILLDQSTSSNYLFDVGWRLYQNNPFRYATLVNKNTDSYVEDYIGILTADEVVLAGTTTGEFGSDARPVNYLDIESSNSWLTTSPSHSNYGYFWLYYVDHGGAINWNGDPYHEYNIRPTITLKSNIETIGVGTKTDPYVVS